MKKVPDKPEEVKPVLVEEVIIEIEKEEKPCPDEMTHVSGLFCTKKVQECAKWLENPLEFPRARCYEFKKSECVGEKVPMDFCIDTEEYSEDGVYPKTNISWTTSGIIAKGIDKRLCSEEEWQFACEGEEMLPYPYGYIRDSLKCNIDITENVVCGKDVCDHRAKLSEFPNCLSPFGVHNMTGNVDEWVAVPVYAHSKDSKMTMRSGLKGGHFLPVRNRCAPITKDHNEFYAQVNTIGVRFCKNVN